jgi:hypothetical protein
MKCPNVTNGKPLRRLIASGEGGAERQFIRFSIFFVTLTKVRVQFER